MTEKRRNTALAIKRCLDSLADDARQGRLSELAHFIGIASLAAEDAARDNEKADDLANRPTMGSC